MHGYNRPANLDLSGIVSDDSIVEAAEEFWMEGAADWSAGDVSENGIHYFGAILQDGRFVIVETSDIGFRYGFVCETEADFRRVQEWAENEFAGEDEEAENNG